VFVKALGPGQVTTATIERIVPGGFGLAHAEGRTLFVAGAAPGDRARVRIERTQGTVVYSRVEEVLTPGPDRVPTPHPTLARCGIDFQHLRYEAQLAAKRAIIEDCLRRIGSLEAPADLAVAPSPREWGYRGRAEWRHDVFGQALGFLETGSHRVVDLAEDPMVEPALAEAFAGLRRRLAEGTLPADVAEFRAAVGDDGSVSVAPAPGGGEPAIVSRRLAGETFDSDADCFFQPNPTLLEPLLAEALRFAPAVGAATDEERPALDLYCGVGLFTLPLARRFGRVVGVESHKRTAEFAARNAEAAGLKGVRIETMPVERWSAAAYRTFGRTPFALVDPPRTGLPTAALRGLLRLRPGRLTYVSCDPATLARDLKLLLAEGYALGGLAAFDMFPQTHHVEVVAHLSRPR
jgi:23S rRNA (uracil1939-C5)-methyltransferase